MCDPGDVTGLSRLLEQAVRMPAEEYAKRAEATKRDLATEMVPLGFYAESYRRILRGESLG